MLDFIHTYHFREIEFYHLKLRILVVIFSQVSFVLASHTYSFAWDRYITWVYVGYVFNVDKCVLR